MSDQETSPRLPQVSVYMALLLAPSVLVYYNKS